MHVAVIDIGKPDKNLGWAIRGPNISGQGGNLDKCIESVSAALRFGPVALGFEAPLFVPMRGSAAELTKARQGECENGINRPFSAGAGASVLVTGLTVIPYVLTKIRETALDVMVTLDWRSPLSQNSLLLFEAFVSNRKSSAVDRHIDDSLLAISAFKRRSTVDLESSVDVPISFNLLGAMLLRTGWTHDTELLAKPCLVVKA
jgi:hypothetical protein